MKLKYTQGFTLIELVIVIVILGILTSVAVPRFFSLQSSAINSTFKSATGAIKSGISNIYALSHGEFPTIEELVANSFETSEGGQERIMDAPDFELTQTTPGGGVEVVGNAPEDPGDGWEAVFIYYPTEADAEYYTKIWYNPDEGRVVDGL